jgi:RNA polymerase sigma-70 factor (ECF subfamily)
MTEREFRAAFLEHQDAVYGFAWRMTGSAAAAEDIAQDTFVELLGHPGRFDAARATLRTFLFGVARNLVLKRWRREKRFAPLDEEAFVAPPLEPAADVARMVARAVAALAPLQREALLLAEYEQMSLDEIAAAVEADVGTVKSRLHRARANLRTALAPLRAQKEKQWNR